MPSFLGLALFTVGNDFLCLRCRAEEMALCVSVITPGTSILSLLGTSTELSKPQGSEKEEKEGNLMRGDYCILF